MTRTLPSQASATPDEPVVSRADRLTADAAEAAAVRAATSHPDVVALRVERVRTQVDVLVWLGIVLGLGFTMANVQAFAAAAAAVWSLPWCAAWLLDPMVSLVLVAVLRAEQVTARWQVGTGTWVNRTKWFCFLATYVMNTWQSWSALTLSGIVLHSVPPVLVFLAAQMAPTLRDRLTEAVNHAATWHTPAPTENPAPEPAAPSGAEVSPAVPAEPETTAGTELAESACEQTIPIPRITDATPGPAPAAKTGPARKPKTRKAKSRAAKPAPAASRSLDELRAELATAIEDGRITAPPSAEQIRTTLRCAPSRARLLRDEYQAETSAVAA
ncbi:hypothetical protein [Sciscionella marina]|uniref:hypothetical protein n=1 Tax=Sciscionella marina TaxID=508770 RepID=UPI00036E3CFD